MNTKLNALIDAEIGAEVPVVDRLPEKLRKTVGSKPAAVRGSRAGGPREGCPLAGRTTRRGDDARVGAPPIAGGTRRRASKR